ncbi:MAG: hypothetical protein M0Z94_06425 [Dehalococcoidales bacterium]|nr:hypothetical protein [Dehalococcoidales bacterium]
MRKVWLLLAGAIVVALLAGTPLYGLAQAAPLDYDIPNGHFFTQTNGQPAGTSPAGYSVTNADGVKFWDEFRRLGGVNVVGYPMSRRFDWDGFVTQVFQKAVFQWRPQEGKVYFVNVFDKLHDTGYDAWLSTAMSTPNPLDGATFDAGKSWDQVVAGRLALLDANPAIKAMYYSVPDPMTLFGLPTSTVVDNGNHYAIRLQRAVIQQWKVDVPWAKAGQATIANGGDVAVQAGTFSSSILAVDYPPGMATPTPIFTPTPTATPRPAVTYSLSGTVHYQNNAGTQWVEGRIYNPDGSPRNGVRVKVSGIDGWSTISRPTGGEMRSDPNGLWTVTLQSPASNFMDYTWFAEVVEDNGQAVTSERVTFYTDRDFSTPDKRQVAFIDFKRNW